MKTRHLIGACLVVMWQSMIVRRVSGQLQFFLSESPLKLSHRSRHSFAGLFIPNTPDKINIGRWTLFLTKHSHNGIKGCRFGCIKFEAGWFAKTFVLKSKHYLCLVLAQLSHLQGTVYRRTSVTKIDVMFQFFCSFLDFPDSGVLFSFFVGCRKCRNESIATRCR